ncbi:MAG: hypothetical protein ACXVEF_15435 [Polyangiales bacterium]
MTDAVEPKMMRKSITLFACVIGCTQEAALEEGPNGSLRAPSTAYRAVKLDRLWEGSEGTVVFIHGHGDCVGKDSDCTRDARGYWSSSGDGSLFLDEASGKVDEQGAWHYREAITVRYDGENQPLWDATHDVAACLSDLVTGTDDSGCNPEKLQRTRFHLVAHSEGGAILDRILSTGQWPDVSDAIEGAPISLAGALGGAKSASALYGVDGASGFCTHAVSALAGWALKDAGSASLTRGTLLGEANNGMAGKSPKWIYKVTTTGGAGSCNNAWHKSVRDSSMDLAMGTLCSCIGTSDDDQADGILWQYDTDPTADPGNSNGGKYQPAFTGRYWHWLSSWSNHSHVRNDAYAPTLGYQTVDGCHAEAPGTCIGQFAW